MSELLGRALQNPRSRISVLSDDKDDEFISKRSGGGIWFEPRMGKRSKRSVIDIGGQPEEAPQHDDLPEEFVDLYPQKFNIEAFLSSPSVILLLQQQSSYS